jgi:hypothetical protein
MGSYINMLWNMVGRSSSPTILGVGLVLFALAYQFLLRHRKAPGKPPMVSHLFPWIGSMISISRDPDRFFRDASSKVGTNGVFGVMVGGNTKYYVTDAAASPLFDFCYRGVHYYLK